MALLSLIAKLGLDKTGFDAGLDSAGKKAAAFGSSLKSQLAGAFGVAAIAAFTKSAMAYASEIADIADRLDISTDAAQQFGLAAKTSGGDLASMTVIFEKFRKERDAALKSGESGPFKTMGIGIEQLQSLDPVSFFDRMADGISANGVAGREGAAAFEIFGKSGGKAIAMLQDLEAAKSRAALISPADLKMAQAFDDSWAAHVQNAKAAVVNFLGDISSGKLSDAFKGDWFSASGIANQIFRRATGAESKGSQAETEDEARIANEKRALSVLQAAASKRDEIKEITKRIMAAEEKNRQAALTTDEKLVEAKQKQADLALAVADAGQDELERAKAMFALTEQEGIVAALQRSIRPDKASPEAKLNKLLTPATSTDSLGRIGGGIGGNGSSGIVSKLERQVRLLEKIDQRFRLGIKIQDL